MAHSSFGSGWPACDRGPIVTLVRADGLRIPLHREIVDLIAMLLDLTEASGVDVRPGETWGYACRAISGTRVASNHSWGTAIDINAPANPYASASWHERNGNTTVRGKRLKTEFNDKIVRMWEAHGFRWGGWYRTKPDPMHFEFMGSVQDARAHTHRLRNFLIGQGNPPPPPPAPRPTPKPTPSAQEYNMDYLDFSGVTRNRSTYITGKHVDNLQALMVPILAFIREDFSMLLGKNSAPDGVGGKGTADAVEKVQKALKYFGNYDGPVDRKVGDKTWKAIIEF